MRASHFARGFSCEVYASFDAMKSAERKKIEVSKDDFARMAKGKGKICIDDPAMAIKLIRKHFPEQADVLIKTEEKPVAKAIGQLTVPELKRIGGTVEEAGDQVVIKPTDSEVDKLISALIADATEEPMDGAA